MMKRFYWKIIVISVFMVSLFTVDAAYVPFVQPSKSGYFEFNEDFSECTDIAEGGNSIANTWTNLANMSTGDAIVNREDSIKWIATDRKSSNSAAYSYSYVDLNNDRMYLRGGASYTAMLALDMTDVVENVKSIPQEIQKISFKHYANSRGTAIAMFPNDGLNTYILFGIRNNQSITELSGIDSGAFVAFVKNGEVVEKFTSPEKSGSGTWDITIENDVISWSMSATGGSWTGCANFDKEFIENCKYIAAFTGYGDVGGYLESFSYKTGNMYSDEFPEPEETLYIDTFDKSKVIDGTEGIYELSEATVVRRVEYQNYSGDYFELSEDCENWDRFDRTYIQSSENDENKGKWTLIGDNITSVNRWVNTCNTKKYKYIKVPLGERIFRGQKTGKVKVFSQITDGDCIEIKKGCSLEIFLSDQSGWATDNFSAQSSNLNYLECNDSSDYISLGYVLLTARKETYTKDISGEPISFTINGRKTNYKLTVKISGPLSEALESQNVDDMNAYIQSQQDVLDRLNEKIAAAMSGSAAAWIDLQNFFNNTTLPDEDDGNGGTRSRLTINDIDACDSNDFALIDDNFAKRISTYGSFTATSFDELETVCDILYREVLVGKFNNLIGGMVQKTDENGDSVFEEDGLTPVYYTEDEIVAKFISEYSRELFLPVDNKYYRGDFASDIRKELAGRVFANYNDLIASINQSTVMTVFKKNSNPSFMLEMFDAYKDTLKILPGSELEKKLDKIKSNDKMSAVFVQSIKNAAEKNPTTLDSPDEIALYLENFDISKVPNDETPQTPVSPTIGSNTQSGVGGIASIMPAVNVTNQNSGIISKPEQLFSDVSLEHWGYEAIRYMKAVGAVSGYEDGDFRPDNPVTRAEFIQMLIKVFKTNEEIPEEYISPFGDITKDEWYYDAISKANILGLFFGTDIGAEPNRYITKQEMAVMIFRMTENQGKQLNREKEIVKFDDNQDIATWAQTSVMKLQTAGIISGYNGLFEPKSNATRAIASMMLFNTVNGFEDIEEIK